MQMRWIVTSLVPPSPQFETIQKGVKDGARKRITELKAETA